MSHPSERFEAPRSITKGQPLKFLMSESLIDLIAESFTAAWNKFDTDRFITQAGSGLQDLELKDRGQQVGAALQACMPDDFGKALPIFVKALGPPLDDSEDIGLKPFYYFPHSHYVAMSAVDHIDAGLEACYQLTKRFTAEFCIRPLIIADEEAVLKMLHTWVTDPDCHVRRLVSEGTRPRLPWAQRLPCFIERPEPLLDLLDSLKCDPSLYVRRSVANSLGDIAKDHLDIVLNTCTEWLEQSTHQDEQTEQNLRWLIRHALRHPDKKGNKRASALRVKAGLRRSR